MQTKQRKINTSFPEDDIPMYNELMRESALTYVPIATLVRKYVRKGMERSNLLPV